MGNLNQSCKKTLACNGREYQYYSLPALQDLNIGNIESLPYSLRILLEGMLRNLDQEGFSEEHIRALLRRDDETVSNVLFQPGRILLQDFTGIPVLNDLAALRAALVRKGYDASIINPIIRTDLVVDHSLQVDHAGCEIAKELNEKIEYRRNRERYQFLHWAEHAFDNLHIIPPGNGIIHQINLEYLADVVSIHNMNGNPTLAPDSLLGTDSHTPMVNGLGVLGWGVGGIEAMGAMLGYPIEFNRPLVVGLRLKGELPANTTPTDLTLTITSKLREHGVVGKFVEIFGEGAATLSLEDRAMIANMTPENGATVTFFPVDQQTLDYLRLTGRNEEKINLVEAYCKEQGLFRSVTSSDPIFDEIVEIDLAAIESVISGPKRPFDVIKVSEMKSTFATSLQAPHGHHGFGLEKDAIQKDFSYQDESIDISLEHGAVILAAITSCTNTSNPGVLLGAGLLAKHAIEKGLQVPSYIKTSLTPGSKVVDMYLKNSGLLPYLEQLGFHIAGHGCATCIGNSGPLPEKIEHLVEDGLIGTAVISGNRNFEGRVHKNVKACYLASPLMVIAYTLAGTVDFDFNQQALGKDFDENPIYLIDILPDPEEIQDMLQHVDAVLFNQVYQYGLTGGERWDQLEYPAGANFEWSPSSSYLREPPFVEHFPPTQEDIRDARVLVLAGDSITTDHISPAGKIAADSETSRYLQSLGCDPKDLNTYGARRGNHEAMVRGTFCNPRFHNALASEDDGGFTSHLPDNEVMSIFKASQKYEEEETPLIVVAGKQYGTGSSRDWAAKGPLLLGIRAVLAESYERIHRSNLIMMGILPLQFREGENAAALGITGKEVFSIRGIQNLKSTGSVVTVEFLDRNGKKQAFKAQARLDTPMEVRYFRNGGIMPTMFADIQGRQGEVIS